MKWFKKKGLWFSIGFEVIGGLLCLACGILAVSGLIIYALTVAVTIVVIAFVLFGGDLSI